VTQYPARVIVHPIFVSLQVFLCQFSNDVFRKLFDALKQDADMQDLSIDSTSCKVHQHAAGAKKGLKIPESFNRCFVNWVQSLISDTLEGCTVSFDGKKRYVPQIKWESTKALYPKFPNFNPRVLL